MYQLEERILFDGAAAVDLAAAQQEHQAQDTQAQAQADAGAHATATSTTGDENQTQNPHQATTAIPADTSSAVPTTDTASADHSTASLSAPIDASNPSQPADTHHVNVLVVSDSLENADALFKSANSDTIVLRYNEKTTTSTELLKEITDALHGEKADSIGFVTDKAHDGAIRIFADGDTSGKNLSTETQQKFWNGVEGLLAEKGKVNLFASDLASTESGRHLVDSLSQITEHQVAASNDVTGDKDAGGNWELEYVAKGTGSVDLIEEYFSRETIQTFDHRIEKPTEIAFIDSSVRDIDTILKGIGDQAEIVYLNKDHAFEQITSYLQGRTDVDAVHLVSDGISDEFYLGNETVNSEFIASHKTELAAWGKAMAVDGDIHIYACNVAENQVGKDLVNQISVITGADVAASTDRTGVAGDWNLEFTSGEIQTAGFVVGDYNYNLATLTVKRLDDYMVTNPSGISKANLTLREALLVSVNGDNIVFADYTVLHSKTSTTPDPATDWPANGGPLYTSSVATDQYFSGIYHFDNGGVFAGGLVDTLTIKTNITIDGNIVTPSWSVGTTVHDLQNHSVILDARSSFRVVYVDSQMNPDKTGVTVQNVIIQNGQSLSTDSAPAAGNGGGIYVSGISSLDFKTGTPPAGQSYQTSTVKDSQATYGGGIFNAGVLNFSGIADSNIADNGVGIGNGGGIYNAGTLICTGSGSVSGNTAAEHGGGIYNDGSVSIKGASPNDEFSIDTNIATIGNGGGIYSNNGNISLTNVWINANDASSGNGGGVFIFSNYEQSVPMHFTRADVYANKAIDGAGIYLTNGNSTSAANVFELEWSSITNNTATGNGGGICLFNNAGNVLLATSITPNTSYNTQSFIFGNKAASGAGVYIEQCENVTMDFTDMSGNIATANGGAIYVKDSGNITLTDMEIAGNQAALGGGIYYTNLTSGSLNVQRSNISSNFSFGDGGGIYQANGILTIENATLSKNAAMGEGGAIYMNYGTLGINFATLAYNQNLGFGSAIYIAGDADPLNISNLTVANSIIYNLNSDVFTSQIYIPVASEIDASGFSTGNNIYSHYFKDLAGNPVGHSLDLTISPDPLVARLYGTDQSAADLIQSNLYLDTNLLYHANYRTMALAILSHNSWAYNATTGGLVTHDQRGNSRTTGNEWTWDNVNHVWISSAKTKTAIGAFDPIFHVEITSNGDDSQLWYTADQNARYFDTASGNGLTLREAIYWIDTRATLKTYVDPVLGGNPLTGEYDSRYVGFNSTYFAVPGDGSVNPNNTIHLKYGQIEIGGRWNNWDSNDTNRDVAVGYMIRNPDNSGDIDYHDNTLRAKNDPNRITVLAGSANGGVNRLFMNTTGSVLALNNLTISGGVGEVDGTQNSTSTNGGGILNQGALTLINMVVQNSTSAGGATPVGGKGGGIYNTGTAYIYDSSILNNTATSIATATNKSPDAGQGGGIWNGGALGVMTIDRSQINGNTVNGSSDVGNAMLGGGIYNAATLTIERSEISGNKATGATIDKNAVKGAGIFNSSILNMANCTIAENTLDTANVKIDYAHGLTWGSYGSGIYNSGDIISYYNTFVNNQAKVFDASFWNSLTLKAVNLESMAAFYNADGGSLKLSNSILAENMAIIFVSGEVWQRSDLYVRTVSDIVVDPLGKGDACHNIIGAYNTPRTEQAYKYIDVSTATTPTINTPVYYELTYDASNNPIYTPIYEFVAQALGSPVNTGFDWNNAALSNKVGFYSIVAATGAPSYLTVNPTTLDSVTLNPLPVQYMNAIAAGTLTTPFIYTPRLLADGSVDPSGIFVRFIFDATTKKYTEVQFNPNLNGGNPANLQVGLYTKVGAVYLPYTIGAANSTYSGDLFSAGTPAVSPTAIFEAGHSLADPGFIPDVSNLRYGIVDNLNLDFTLNYNGAMTRTLRVLSGSVAMDQGTLLVDGTFLHLDTDQRGVDRLFRGGVPTTVTNIGAFDYLSGSLVVRSAADTARTGFDYESYTPLWESGTLSLREAVMLADDASDITFKDTWQINGTLNSATGQIVTNELDASGNLIINLTGELLVNRSITINGMYEWNDVDAAGIPTRHHTGYISTLVAEAHSRIFNVKNDVSTTLSTVAISNFVMDGNGSIVTGSGGGIFSYSNLSLDNVTVKNCTSVAGVSGTDGLGGGIYSEAGYLILINSLIDNNSGTIGGGIFVVGGTPDAAGFALEVTGTGITGNTATNVGASEGKGGGVYLQSGTGRFRYSTIGDNHAVSDGGGIYIATTGGLSLFNSTVANNSSGRNGGGISYFSNNALNIDFTTVANNQSGWTILGAPSGNPYQFGGGIYINSGSLSLTNSILAQNFRGAFDQDAGVHDDLYTLAATNTVRNSVYGATAGNVSSHVSNKQVGTLANPWSVFKGKLDTNFIYNGGKNKTVYVVDDTYFQGIVAANAIQVDQTMIEVWANRTTVGSYEKIAREFYYIDGEISKGSDGGSNWISGNGVLLGESDGVLNASDATFVLQNTTRTENYHLDYSVALSLSMGYIVATVPTVNHILTGTGVLDNDWTMNDPIVYHSNIELRGLASFTVSEGVTLNGKISVRSIAGDANTLILQTSNLSSTYLSIHSTGVSNNIVTYSSASPAQTVFTVDETGTANTYDYLNLYGKDRGAAALAELSVKNAAGTLIVLKDITLGNLDGANLRDNVKLSITTTGTGPGTNYGDLNFSGTLIRNYGQIEIQRNMIVSDLTIDGIAGFSTLTAGNISMNNFTVTAMKSITVTAGDLTLSNGTIDSVPTFDVTGNMSMSNVTGNGIAIVTVTGNMTMDMNSIISGTPAFAVTVNNLTMTDSTITSASTLSVHVLGGGDLTMSNSAIDGISTTVVVTGNLSMTNGSLIKTVVSLSAASMDVTDSSIDGNAANITVSTGDMQLTGSIITGVAGIDVAGDMIMGNGTITGNSAIISVTGNLLMSNFSTITGAAKITVLGSLTVTDGIIDGGSGIAIANITGNVNLVGNTNLTNVTIKAGGVNTIFFGDAGGTTTIVTLNGVILGTASNGVEFKDNSSIIANGMNNQITAKRLTVTDWTNGTITVTTAGAFKINIGTQSLTLTDTVTNSTATALQLGLDRLIVNANSRLEIATTNTVTSIATSVAPSIDGTLALSGIISFGSTNIISLSSTATLELGGTVTITKDAVGTAATISMQNSLNVVGNVKVNAGVTGNISITSTGGSIIIGSDVTAGSNFTGNGRNLTISANTDASVGNIYSVGTLSVTSTTGNIHLLNSIGVTGSIFFNGDVKVHLAYTNSTRTPASVTPITVTAGTGTIITTGTGYSTFGLDCSELQLSSGSASANALKTVNLNRSLTLLKGVYASNGITLTGTTANFLIKGTQAVTVTGNIILNGGRLDNPVILSVSGDISMLNGTLNNLATGTIKMTGGAGSDVILAGNSSFVNAGTFSNASSAISLVNGSLTNSKTLNAASIAFSGAGSLTNTSSMTIGGTITLASGSLTNSKALTVSGSINLSGGSLTNTGTITVANNINLAGAGSLNNNAGTITANTVSLATGTFTNKGSLNANSLDLGGGNLVNPGILKERSAGLSHIALVGGGTFTNTGTVTSFDTLTLDGANLSSGTKAFNVTTLNLLGAGTRNLTISPLGMTVATLNMTVGNAKMIGGKLSVTGDFSFGAAAPNQYFQLGNIPTSIATLEVKGAVVNDSLTHFFVTLGNNKVWVNPGLVGTSIPFFLSDGPTNFVSQVDIGVTSGTSKMVGISTFTPLTVNGKYNGQHAGHNTILNSVGRVWNITRTTGEFSPLTVKFHWAAAEQGANLNAGNAKLWTIAGSSWSLTNPGTGAGFAGDTYETSILRYSGSYSVSAFVPSLAMDDNSSLGAQLDELKEKFIDAIFGTKEDLVEQQQVAEAQERSAMENMLSQMANRGSLMERNKLFKTDVDISLEQLFSV